MIGSSPSRAKADFIRAAPATCRAGADAVGPGHLPGARQGRLLAPNRGQRPKDTIQGSRHDRLALGKQFWISPLDKVKPMTPQVSPAPSKLPCSQPESMAFELRRDTEAALEQRGSRFASSVAARSSPPPRPSPEANAPTATGQCSGCVVPVDAVGELVGRATQKPWRKQVELDALGDHAAQAFGQTRYEPRSTPRIGSFHRRLVILRTAAQTKGHAFGKP